jgi:hypothetical protein
MILIADLELPITTPETFYAALRAASTLRPHAEYCQYHANRRVENLSEFNGLVLRLPAVDRFGQDLPDVGAKAAG